MLTQILPGLREIRAPLTAGFMWLALGYMLLKGRLSASGGPVREIIDLGPDLPQTVWLTVAVFVAYLVGSLSEDAIAGNLTRLLREFLFEGTHFTPGAPPTEPKEGLSASFYETQMTKVENDADRLAAEVDLRVALIAPTVAWAIYLGIEQSGWWFCAIVLAPILIWQAWLRSRHEVRTRINLYKLRREAGLPISVTARESVAERSVA